MENSNQYDEFLIRYLVNELNAEEKIFIEKWIDSNEQNRKHFEELKNAWNLVAVKQTLDVVLDPMYVEEKWDRLKQNLTATEAKAIPLSRQEERESESGEEERPGRKSVVYRLLVSVAIAASVLLVVGLGWKFLAGNKQETPVALDNTKKADSIVAVVRHEVNTTGKEKTVHIPDGSMIVLADKSEISYQEPFTNKRDIVLTGKAYFKVAKDKTKPFTVISGDISTTALGTEFTVTALEKANKIIVRLYEGKVVVKAVDKANRRMKNDVYLVPGQEFIYSSKTTPKVKAFTWKNDAAPGQILNEERFRDDPLLPKNEGGSWYMFNNQTLEQVLNELAALYNIKIVYDKRDVQNIYFTGKYNRSESLELILNRIGTLNNLTITKKDTAFIISR